MDMTHPKSGLRRIQIVDELLDEKDFMVVKLEDPGQPFMSQEQLDSQKTQKEVDQKKIKENLAHQVDLALRKATG